MQVCAIDKKRKSGLFQNKLRKLRWKELQILEDRPSRDCDFGLFENKLRKMQRRGVPILQDYPSTEIAAFFSSLGLCKPIFREESCPLRIQLIFTCEYLPGTVNSGCPRSVSKYATLGWVFRRVLTINLAKPDLPIPFVPAMAIIAGLPSGTSLAIASIACRMPVDFNGPIFLGQEIDSAAQYSARQRAGYWQ